MLRSRYSKCSIVVVAETDNPIDVQRILTLAADGYLVNIESDDVLIKSLDLALSGQQTLVLGRLPPLLADECREPAVTF